MKDNFQSKAVPRGTRTIWRYLSALLILFTFAIGQMWAADITVVPTIGQNVNTLPYGLFTISHSSTKGDSKISSGAIAANTKEDVITINFKTTKSDMYIKSVTFNSLNNGALSSPDGTISSNTFTASGNKNDVNVVLTSNSNAKGTVKITNVVVNTGTNTVETITFNSFDGTAKTFGFTSSAGASSSLTSISSNNSNSVSSNILSWSNSRTLVFATSGKITYAAFVVNDGKAYTGFSADKGTYADNYSWTGDVETLTLSNGTGGGRSIKNFYLIIAPATKHHVTYALNGGDGTTPTQADVAEGASFTVASATGITPPTNKKFFKWYDGANYYAAGDSYTMGTSDVTLTAQWVDDLPDPTATFADATYIIGSGTLNMASKFSSNSSGAVTYSLKVASANAEITAAGVFSATVAGEYVVVANQAQVAGTYSAISKEATVTVLDNELSDIFIISKKADYGGDGKCLTAEQANTADGAHNYVDIAYEGFSKMGRAGSDNVTCILTFSVKSAYSSLFGIENICTYGKFEEPAGGQISWDGGANWEDLAAYAEGKKEFNAPSATFPESFKIRFLGVSKDAGGLWWRNALVTLEVKKTVTGVTEALVGAEINGEAISAANLATLLEDKTLDIATTYAAAPTVTFKKQVTTTYAGGWAPDVMNVDVEVTASDNTTAWQASATVGGQAYIINLAKPAGPSLETEATAFTLTSAKVATDTKKFTFSGVNLTSGNVTISLENAVAGMTVSPAEVTPTAGAITDQEVTITYKSLETVAEANVNLVVYYDADTKIIIPLTYSSTAGVEDLTPISAATTWNWDGAADAAFGTLGQNDMIVLVNADVTWNASFNASAIAGKLQHYYRDGKYAQGDELKFNTTIPGKVYVTYSNTGGNAARTVNVNGVKGSLTTEGSGEKRTESFAVNAGDVLIKGVQVSDDAAKMLRYYEVRFAPTFTVTYAAGEGTVKSGETLPTQADEAAGEKIVLAAATALEKTGDDFAGWLCSVDGETYQPGDEYTMTAAATTFTAQWVLHVEPVDPTLTYDEGAYTIGLAALDLSTLITTKTSTGAISYSIKDAGTTGATLEGKNFSATAAGTAVITASQAAVLGYNAKTVDFSVVVTEASEIDGIKLVEAGALTGNFITASTLTDGANTIEGINYAKYIKFSSTFSGSYQGGAKNNYFMYDLKKQNTTFYLYVHNNSGSTAYKVLVYTYNTTSTKATEIEVAAGENALKSFELNDVTENTRVFIGVDNTNLYICQVVAVETGSDLLKGGDIGYEIDFAAKSRFSAAGGTAITMDGMEFVTSSQYVPNSGTEVALTTLGTNYVKFTLTERTEVEVKTNTANKYFIGSTYNKDEATSKTYEYKPSATGETHIFDLAVGTWYLNPDGSNIKLLKLAFNAHATNDATLSALSYGDPEVAINLVADKFEYRVALDEGTTVVPALHATATKFADGATVAINDATSFTDNKATSKVTVTAEDGTTKQTYTVNFVVKHTYTEMVDVTGSTTWSWEGLNEDQKIDDVDNQGLILANYVNAENFEMISGKESEYANRNQNGGVYQGTELFFKATVDGIVRVNFRAPSGGENCTITINGTNAGTHGNSFTWSKYVEVPAGTVTITMTNDKEGGGMTRVQKIEFLALGNSRDVTVGDLGTVCLPNKCIARGVEVYELQGKEPTYGKIVFDELDQDELLGAGKAYIFQVKEATARFYYTTDAAVTSPDASSALRGNLDAEPIVFSPNSSEAENVYFIKEHAFWCAKETGVKINQYRAYLQMDEVGTASPAPAPGRRRIALGVQGEQVATALDNLNADDAPRKVIIDGQLFIIRGEKMFDATGRLVK